MSKTIKEIIDAVLSDEDEDNVFAVVKDWHHELDATIGHGAGVEIVADTALLITNDPRFKRLDDFDQASYQFIRSQLRSDGELKTDEGKAYLAELKTDRELAAGFSSETDRDADLNRLVELVVDEEIPEIEFREKAGAWYAEVVERYGQTEADRMRADGLRRAMNHPVIEEIIAEESVSDEQAQAMRNLLSTIADNCDPDLDKCDDLEKQVFGVLSAIEGAEIDLSKGFEEELEDTLDAIAENLANRPIAFYAAPKHLVDTPQYQRDVMLINELGFQVHRATGLIEEDRAPYEAKGLDAFHEALEECEVLFFRAFPDHSIGAGVGGLIHKAVGHDIPVVELPTSISTRIRDVDETREILAECGQR